MLKRNERFTTQSENTYGYVASDLKQNTNESVSEWQFLHTLTKSNSPNC